MTSDAHFSHLTELVRLELQCERDAYSQVLSSNNISGRTANGDCLYPVALTGTSRNALDQLIVHLHFDNSTDEDLSKGFEPGRPAIFFTLENEGSKDLQFQCFVSTLGEDFIELILPNKAALMSLDATSKNKLIGLRAAIDETSYRVMLESLHDAARATNESWVRLRETLVGTLQPRFRELPMVSIPWLNNSQQQAVQKVVEARETAIIHGPPGTGKTTTLVEAIIETLQRETQVLVCAPSNAAVDWISEQLSRRSVNVLRIGNPLRMSTEMLDCSYERRYAAHPDYAELWSIRKALREGRSGEGKSREKQARMAKMRDRAIELEIRINADLFNQARVVSCTLIGSAYHILEHHHFSTLFIDEAAQALEPACWAAILKCDRVIFSGDHHQLPPTIKSPAAAKGGLEQTLMQRVAKNKPDCVSLLNVQYRMNKDIMGFSSRWFYKGQLKAAPEVAERQISPLDTPLMWIDTSQCHFDEKQSHTLSRTNGEEAKMLIHNLRDYIEMIGIERIQNERVDFGIISPYRAQVRLIRRLLKLQKFFRTLRHQITVNSVDGFQGQERDVIVISMVRDNDQGTIGFLRDLRRMNVAMTRAKMKLIVLGNADTLSQHPFYNQLINYFKEHGEFVSAMPPENLPQP